MRGRVVNTASTEHNGLESRHVGQILGGQLLPPEVNVLNYLLPSCPLQI